MLKSLLCIGLIVSSTANASITFYDIEIINQKTREVKAYHKDRNNDLKIGIDDYICYLSIENHALCAITCFNKITGFGTTGVKNDILALRLFSKFEHSYTITAICGNY